MTTKELQEIKIKLQEKVCPDCGGERDSEGNCPVCNPGLEGEELGEENLDEEESKEDELE